MSQPSLIELYFIKSPIQYGYHANTTAKVPKALADTFVEQGIARLAKESLPADIPERKALIDAGVETIEAVIEKHAESCFKKVKGIGEAKAKQLEQWLIEQGHIAKTDEE